MQLKYALETNSVVLFGGRVFWLVHHLYFSLHCWRAVDRNPLEHKRPLVFLASWTPVIQLKHIPIWFSHLWVGLVGEWGERKVSAVKYQATLRNIIFNLFFRSTTLSRVMLLSSAEFICLMERGSPSTKFVSPLPRPLQGELVGHEARFQTYTCFWSNSVTMLCLEILQLKLVLLVLPLMTANSIAKGQPRGTFLSFLDE